MANVADFVGTWYFRGDKSQRCSIQLQGTKLRVTNEHNESFIARMEGGEKFVSESNPAIHGTLSSNGQIIAWHNGEIWTR